MSASNLDHTGDDPARGRMLRAFRSIEGAALAGLVYAALWLTSHSILYRAPRASATDTAAVDWYGETANQQSAVTAVNLMAIGCIAFLWFVAVIRRRVGERESRFFGTVFLGSALLLTGSWLFSVVLFATPALSPYLFGVDAEPTDVALFQAAGITMNSVVSARLSAVFILSATTVGRLSQTFPRILLIAGYVIAALLLLNPLPTTWLTWLFAAWVAMVSGHMLVKQRRLNVIDLED